MFCENTTAKFTKSTNTFGFEAQRLMVLDCYAQSHPYLSLCFLISLTHSSTSVTNTHFCSIFYVVKIFQLMLISLNIVLFYSAMVSRCSSVEIPAHLRTTIPQRKLLHRYQCRSQWKRWQFLCSESETFGYSSGYGICCYSIKSGMFC